MKKIILVVSTLLLLHTVQAQSATAKMPPLDKSPMDMAYFPANYPVLKIQDKATDPLTARVIYSRPQRNGRVVFGTLEAYKKVWRLGANEATEIEFYKDVTIGNKKVAKGRYTLYAIPDSAQWTIAINRETDTWGAFKYDEKKDITRVTVPVQTVETPQETFTMMFDKTATGANLIMGWDTVMVSLPIAVK